MSSAFKTLHVSDITISPYKANKSYVIPSSSYEEYGIRLLSGTYSDLSNILNFTQSNINYYAIRHLYYANSLPDQNYNSPIVEQSYGESQAQLDPNDVITKNLYYENYLQSTAASGTLELDDRSAFPTSSINDILIISIPKAIYGEAIKPGSVIVGEGKGLVDDGNGNLITSSSRAHVGNVIYSHGLIVVTTPIGIQYFIAGTCNNYRIQSTVAGAPLILNYVDCNEVAVQETLNLKKNQVIKRCATDTPIPIGGGATVTAIGICGDSTTFQSEVTIYQNQIRCHVNENEFNMTQNPTAISGSSGSLSDYVTGSDFNPYITTVGLYNENSELLAVGKLAQPYPIPSNTDITFVVKYDS